jgi:hypothetical protein
MSVTKDLNMYGLCEWLDPQMLDIGQLMPL